MGYICTGGLVKSAMWQLPACASADRARSRRAPWRSLEVARARKESGASKGRLDGSGWMIRFRCSRCRKRERHDLFFRASYEASSQHASYHRS